MRKRPVEIHVVREPLPAEREALLLDQITELVRALAGSGLLNAQLPLPVSDCAGGEQCLVRDDDTKANTHF